MSRVLAVIDREALAHNLAQVRRRAPDSRIYAAVKADGYGHGAVTAALAFADADGFAVSSLEEALQLRWAGIRQAIVLLSQPLDTSVCDQAAAHDLEVVVFHASQLEALEAWRGPAVTVWVKIDSGMHRLGFAVDDIDAVADRLAEIEAVGAIEIAGWLSHLARADEADPAPTERQIACFSNATAARQGLKSLANSAGVLGWPATHADVVRPGIMLYGSSPMHGRSAAELDLRGAMHLSAPVIAINRLAAGEPVGYGATWQSPQATDIAVVGIGYGDGYPRHAANGTPVVIGGRRFGLAGRVSMDMITVDLGGADHGVAVGDRATLWGNGLDVDEVARSAGTIAYELFCRLTPRVRFETR